MRETMQTHRERGQTLVIVALALTTLLLMVGLVTDIGVWYNARRDMQNAADAAALAGAWKFCDQNNADSATQTLARNEAIRVAQTVHGSDPDGTVVSTGNSTVSVTTAIDSPLFFFKLVGIDTIPVNAEAEAVCGCASELGGAWPIAFDLDT